MIKTNSPESWSHHIKKVFNFDIPLHYQDRRVDKGILISVQSWKESGVRLWGGGVVCRIQALKANRLGFNPGDLLYYAVLG